MADIANAELFGEPGDAALLGDAADFGRIGLHDVEGTAYQPGREALSAGQYFSAGNRDRGLPPELAKIIYCIGLQRLFEPAGAIVGEHMRGIEGPAQAVWPIGVAGAGIDKELVRIADGFASRFHDCLIELPVVAPSERDARALDVAGGKRLGRAGAKIWRGRRQSAGGHIR